MEGEEERFRGSAAPQEGLKVRCFLSLRPSETDLSSPSQISTLFLLPFLAPHFRRL